MSAINEGLSQLIGICGPEILDHLPIQDLANLRRSRATPVQVIDEYVRHKLAYLNSSKKPIRSFFATQEALTVDSSWRILGALKKVFPTLTSFNLTQEDIETHDLTILKNALTKSTPHLTGLVTRKDAKAIQEWFNVPANQALLANKIKTLDLSGKGLFTIPKEIKFLTNLNDLNLRDNYIQEIPEDVFKGLTQLKSLNLCFNQIEKVKNTSFQGLDNLTTLELAYNRLKECPNPSSLGLQKLKTLQVDNNLFQAPT